MTQMTHEDLLEAVSYDPSTGVFTRNKTAGNTLAGSPIGNLDKKGYLKAMVLGEYVKLHRLAWFYVHGLWPTQEIDHINTRKSDNRNNNLRDCGTSTNCLNQHGPRKHNRVGLQGVHQIQKTGRFRAACTVQGSKHHLGVYATAEEASDAYLSFKTQYLPNAIP